MRPHFDLRSRLPLLVLLVVAAPFTAHADIVLPGTTVHGPNAPANTLFQGGMLLDGMSNTVTTADFTGVARTAVFRNPSGFLDFYYQFSNSAGSMHSILGQSLSDYRGFTTNVFNVTNASAIGSFGFTDGTVDSRSVSRSADGADVLFDFSGPAAIMPGQTSLALLVQTNATDFIFTPTGHTLFGSQGTAPGFQPATVPEPATVLLLGSGLAGAALKVRRRRKGKET